MGQRIRIKLCRLLSKWASRARSRFFRTCQLDSRLATQAQLATSIETFVRPIRAFSRCPLSFDSGYYICPRLAFVEFTRGSAHMYVLTGPFALMLAVVVFR